jgi:hypothetical protein
MPTSHNAANDPAGTIAADLGATVITGAAGGMGRASAERLAAPGRRLILCDLREESLAEVAGVVKERGAQVDLIAGDICDSGFSASLTERLGDSAIGALIHTAGLSPTMAEAARILEVNLFATRRLVDGLRQRMAPGGSMVLISSCSAYMIPPGAFSGELKTWLETSSQDELLAAAQTPESAYPASKRGIIALVAHEADRAGLHRHRHEPRRNEGQRANGRDDRAGAAGPPGRCRRDRQGRGVPVLARCILRDRLRHQGRWGHPRTDGSLAG